MLRFYTTAFKNGVYKFNELATAHLRNIYEKLELIEDIEAVDFNGTVLNVTVEDNKLIVINKHEPSQQIWYSSFTGVDYFNFKDNEWISDRSGKNIAALISEDINKILGSNFDLCDQ